LSTACEAYAGRGRSSEVRINSFAEAFLTKREIVLGTIRVVRSFSGFLVKSRRTSIAKQVKKRLSILIA
jgi:hypothetical protein